MQDTSHKIRNWSEALRWRLAASGPVVFTNGVFDLLHPGHVALLEHARDLGAALMVGLNSDISVRTLGKGPDRPLQPEAVRARILAALAAVDCVTLFNEDTPRDLIASLRPDILVKGGDYRAEDVVGGDLVTSRGGRVVIVPLVAGFSTTFLAERLRGTS